VRGSQPAPPAPPPTSNEPSFAREALARSVPHVEQTLSMSDADIAFESPPKPAPKPPSRKPK
jgi:hypothetical protein